MSDTPNDGWLIHKQGRGWYRPKAQGYTMNPEEAGRYTYKDAMSYSHPNGHDGPRDGITIKHESEIPTPIYVRAEIYEAERARADRLEAEMLGLPRQDEDWGDRRDQYSDAISETHPFRRKDWERYYTAQKLVNNRHSKASLIALVAWLLTDEARAAIGDEVDT